MLVLEVPLYWPADIYLACQSGALIVLSDSLSTLPANIKSRLTFVEWDRKG